MRRMYWPRSPATAARYCDSGSGPRRRSWSQGWPARRRRGRRRPRVLPRTCLFCGVPAVAARSCSAEAVSSTRLPFLARRNPALRRIRPSYGFILGQIRQTLAGGAGLIEQAGISDLILAGRKFSGTAQQPKRSFLLHHGTLLYDMDLSLIPRYLREPPRQPEYRAGRSHLAFVGNLPLSNDEIKQRLRRLWGADDEQSTCRRRR